MNALNEAISAETAYVVEDYPYGFRLRCKLRAWVEYKPGKGFRFVTQTTNPKAAGEVWNKPKAGTYDRMCGVLTLAENNGHISYRGLNEYSSLQDYKDFYNKYRANFTPRALDSFQYWEALQAAKEGAYIALNVHNIYNATREEQAAIMAAVHDAMRDQRAKGRSY